MEEANMTNLAFENPMTIDQAVEILGKSRTYVKHKINSGALPSVKIGGRYIIAGRSVRDMKRGLDLIEGPSTAQKETIQ